MACTPYKQSVNLTTTITQSAINVTSLLYGNFILRFRYQSFLRILHKCLKKHCLPITIYCDAPQVVMLHKVN